MTHLSFYTQTALSLWRLFPCVVLHHCFQFALEICTVRFPGYDSFVLQNLTGSTLSGLQRAVDYAEHFRTVSGWPQTDMMPGKWIKAAQQFLSKIDAVHKNQHNHKMNGTYIPLFYFMVIYLANNKKGSIWKESKLTVRKYKNIDKTLLTVVFFYFLSFQMENKLYFFRPTYNNVNFMFIRHI